MFAIGENLICDWFIYKEIGSLIPFLHIKLILFIPKKQIIE